MSKLSVYVIAYNDEPNMRACLESVKVSVSTPDMPTRP